MGFGMHNLQLPLTLSLEDAGYVSPEVAQGQTVNTRSDIYSLGVMLYELCTGTLPFQGDTTSDMLLQHIHAAPMSPALINPHIVPGMTAIILRCLAKDPSARFPNGAALTAALAKVMSAPGMTRMGQSGAGVSGNRLTPWFSSAQLINDNTYLSPQRAQGLPEETISGKNPVGNVSGSYQATNVPTSLSSAPTSSARALTPDGVHTPSQPDMTAHSQQPDLLSSMETQRLQHSPLPVTPTRDSLPVGAAPPPRRNRLFRTRRARTLTIVGSVLLCLLVIAAGLTAFFTTQHNNSIAAPSLSGHAFFVSSGLLDPNNPKGIVDGLQIDLTNIPPPQPGKGYYAWLLGDTDSNPASPPIAMGTLSVLNGHASKAYNSDQNDNLLSHYSRFLVTEEDATAPPSNPSLDPATWRYGPPFHRCPIRGISRIIIVCLTICDTCWPRTLNWRR
ncbi:serine/threonine protein kinase [Dictyobacter kobayashii]|uniref:non-specific serine/threonine protein kinase n=1 Tax=Dictyobacter kobayashii TaxID=2014872 RepID=A0A402AFI9_9CHLR|nr:serine/threonine-protein kinase [Dictyobacter kobayashii]GCE17878.1 hypothetical protein KDK_16780 [Dictyobacter kobayashii]